MADVTIPHFDLPFRFGTGGGNAAVVQQDSSQDVRNCVEAVVRTELGSRLFVPNFGMPDPTFGLNPVATHEMEEAILTNEPRAVLAFTSVVDTVNAIIDDITLEVSRSV